MMQSEAESARQLRLGPGTPAVPGQRGRRRGGGGADVRTDCSRRTSP